MDKSDSKTERALPVPFDNIPCRVDLGSGAPSYTWIRRRDPSQSGSASRAGEMKTPVDMVWTVMESATKVRSTKKTYLGVANPFTMLARAELDKNGRYNLSLPGPEKKIRLRRATQCVITPSSTLYNVSVSYGIPRVETSEPRYGRLFSKDKNTSENDAENVTCWPVSKDAPFASLTATGLYEFTRASRTNDPSWRHETSTSDSGTLTRIQSLGLEKVTSNIAASMTKTGLDSSALSVPGAVSVSTVYVHVTWAFIIIPTALLLLGVVFLVTTIVVSRRHERDVGLWKTSIPAGILSWIGGEVTS
ncbi:uncharacterized protein BDV17DRAFT_291940 [Aspergillus undulatus]|uniref:uncharacterized protein n=1 Tax=Aspergillus undulatus TaxID=1810928 RepID=UPI003CCD13C1